MRDYRWLVPALLALLAAPGCQAAQSRRAALAAASEPGLATSGDQSGTTVAAQPPRNVTFADRHPLFTKPREYYDSSGDNKAAKVAAATIVGIPAGIVGELRQIVDGRPPGSTY